MGAEAEQYSYNILKNRMPEPEYSYKQYSYKKKSVYRFRLYRYLEI